MKSQKVAGELNNVIEATSRCRMKHQKTIRTFLMQFKVEEKRLIRKLKNATDESSRDKWEEKLGLVREAYQALEA